VTVRLVLSARHLSFLELGASRYLWRLSFGGVTECLGLSAWEYVDGADVGVELEGTTGGEEEAPERDVVEDIWHVD
jgi:hypothetical protein